MKRPDPKREPEQLGKLLSFVREQVGARDGSTFTKMLETREAELAEAASRRRVRNRTAILKESGVEIPEDDVTAIAEDRLGGVQCDERCATFRARNENTADCQRYHSDAMVKRWLARAGSTIGPRVPQFLALCGPTGVGKTVACAWVIAEYGGGHAVAAMDLVDAQRSRASALFGTRVLVVDDLGTEDAEPRRFASALNNVINKRHRDRWKLTLFTSNLSRAALVARYDTRTIERIRRLGYIADVLGKNMREAME
jgi:DNA replication protein DnaC